MLVPQVTRGHFYIQYQQLQIGLSRVEGIQFNLELMVFLSTTSEQQPQMLGQVMLRWALILEQHS